jgi:hypothetical protein
LQFRIHSRVAQVTMNGLDGEKKLERALLFTIAARLVA